MAVQVKVLFFIPNIIGYCRLVIIAVAWIQWENPNSFIGLFMLSGGLDFVDGIIARKLGQTSAFGAWLDVVVDNISRSMIWIRLFPSTGFVISSLEWLTFVCTHQIGNQWKTPTQNQPWFIVQIMSNNFNTPVGLWVISSIWFLPVWFYALIYYRMLFTWTNKLITAFLVAGRLLASIVEGWFIWQHICILLREQEDQTL